MKLAEIPELKGVSPAEKVELIDELWASMPRESFPAPESHLTELHRRVAAVQEDLSRALIPRKPVKRFAPRRGYDEATQLGNPGGGPDDVFQARWSCAGSWHFSASRQTDWTHSIPPEPSDTVGVVSALGRAETQPVARLWGPSLLRDFDHLRRKADRCRRVVNFGSPDRRRNSRDTACVPFSDTQPSTTGAFCNPSRSQTGNNIMGF
jgi:putative addiction module component (TIGR02574 family)